ncbi:ABC transporter ATP-binding protein [Planctomycetaceae bacterium SH139]
MESDTANNGEPVSIRLSEVTVAFAGQAALDRVSLSLAPGRITAILGPSGCGKSTLLRAVAGLQPATSGSIAFQTPGTSRPQLPPGELGYVFQDAALLPWRTAWENVLLPLELLGQLGKQPRRELAAQQLRGVGLAESDWQKLSAELSGGMRMRVSIARALTTDPSVLLLDEPFSALDDILRRRLGDLVLELWRQRARTIVLVTHNIDEAILLSDHLVVMGQGRVATEMDIDLQHQGHADPRRTQHFTDLYAEVAEALREAVR